MTTIQVTDEMQDTPAEALLLLMDQAGLSLLLYKDLSLSDFVSELAMYIPKVANSEQTKSGILQLREYDYTVYWVPLKTGSGTIAVFSPFANNNQVSGFARDFMVNYLEPIKGLEPLGYEISTASRGDISDSSMAMKLQQAHI